MRLEFLSVDFLYNSWNPPIQASSQSVSHSLGCLGGRRRDFETISLNLSKKLLNWGISWQHFSIFFLTAAVVSVALAMDRIVEEGSKYCRNRDPRKANRMSNKNPIKRIDCSGRSFSIDFRFIFNSVTDWWHIKWMWEYWSGLVGGWLVVAEIRDSPSQHKRFFLDEQAVDRYF